MSRTAFAGVFVAFALWATGGRSEASFVVFTDLAAWQAAAGPSSLETFGSSALSNTTGAYGPVAFNGFTLSGNGNGNNLGVHNGVVSYDGPDTDIPASFLGQNFFSWGGVDGGGDVIGPLTLTFATPTFAFGFDWFNTDQTDQYQVAANPPGMAFASPPFTVVPRGTATSGFFGVVSTTRITSATISNQFIGGYISDEGFDNVRVAGVASVPEPSSLALCGISGLAGLAAARRRRRATRP